MLRQLRNKSAAAVLRMRSHLLKYYGLFKRHTFVAVRKRLVAVGKRGFINLATLPFRLIFFACGHCDRFIHVNSCVSSMFVFEVLPQM